MLIDNVQLNVELEQILDDLQRELAVNDIQMFSKGFKRTSDNIMLQCPYHSNGQEHRPSSGIHCDTGIFHCFACGETHPLAEVISHCFGYNDSGMFGWKWLLKNYASVSVEERGDVKLDFSRNNIRSSSRSSLGSRSDSDSTDARKYVSEEELDKYRYTHPYMYKRGLTDEVIELFDIGYDKSTRCITFPVRDIKGRCLFVARRSVDYKFFNYPQGVEKPLYGLYEIHKICTHPYNLEYVVRAGDSVFKVSGPRAGDYHSYLEEVVVCESMLDALSFWTVGKGSVALNGLGNELQFKQLRELPCRKLILCTDMDEAGLKARARIRRNVKNKIITEYRLPKGRKDANECTVEELKMLKDVIA